MDVVARTPSVMVTRVGRIMCASPLSHYGPLCASSPAHSRDEAVQPLLAPFQLLGARHLLQRVFRAQRLSPGRDRNSGHDANGLVTLSNARARCRAMRGESRVDILGEAGVEDTAAAFEPIQPPGRLGH